MAAQTRKVPTIENLKQWQRVVGWWDHENDAPKALPFSLPEDPTSALKAAEDEKADILVTHYVDSVLREGLPPEAVPHNAAPSRSDSVDEAGDTEALLEKGTHALVFGYNGEGKSACRITIAREATRRGFLVAEYLSVGQEARDYQEHAATIAELIWTAIQAAGWLVITEQPAQNTKPVQRLKSLIRLLVPDHFEGIFILVDNVEDNLGPVWTMDDVGEAIEPFFDPQLLGLRGLRFKLFLPRETASRVVARYPAVNHSSKHGFKALWLHWTKTHLRRCLDDRLRDVVASQQQVFGSFADDHSPDLVDQVIDAALSMSGAPRNLFALVHEMIILHVRHESDLARHRLTLGDFERARRNVFLARIQGEIYRQKGQIQLRERQLDRARHAGDEHLFPQIAAWLVQLLQNTNALYHQLLAWVQQGALAEPEVPERLQEVRSLLLRIEMRLEDVHEEATDIRSLVVHLRREIIETYEEGSRVVVDTLIETMTRFHVQNVHLAIRAVNSAHLTHDEITQAFATIESALQSVHADVQGIDDEFRDTLSKLDAEIKKAPSMAHKLKLAIPLLPFLTYEAELKRDLHDDLMKVVRLFRKADHTFKSAQPEGDGTRE